MRKLFLILLLLPPMAWAQQATLPSYQSIYVNDYANLLSKSATQKLTSALTELRSETSVEMTVLTIKTRDSYGLHSSLRSFARDTFNEWGIGDATKNNGILFLVASDDREMRIELGSGYSRRMDQTAEDIIDTTILPQFADGDFEGGILRGAEEIERKIARGEPGGGSILTPANIIPVLFGGIFATVIGSRFIARRRERHCPACKSQDISKTIDSAAGRGRLCNNCGHGYLLAPTMTIQNSTGDDGPSSRGGSRGGGFGGGSSSGGGASGRW